MSLSFTMVLCTMLLFMRTWLSHCFAVIQCSYAMSYNLAKTQTFLLLFSIQKKLANLEMFAKVLCLLATILRKFATNCAKFNLFTCVYSQTLHHCHFFRFPKNSMRIKTRKTRANRAA